MKPEEDAKILTEGYKKTKVGDEIYYQFSTEKIGAGNLGIDYTVEVETDKGTAKVTASAMAYVNAVLKEGSTFEEKKQTAMAAYYFYYAAAVTYRDSQ